MDSILEFFKSVGAFFSFLYDLIVSSVNGAGAMTQAMSGFVDNLSSYLAWIPDSVIAVFGFGFSICILRSLVKVGASFVGAGGS